MSSELTNSTDALPRTPRGLPGRRRLRAEATIEAFQRRWRDLLSGTCTTIYDRDLGVGEIPANLRHYLDA